MSKFYALKKQLKNLMVRGDMLYYAMADAQDKLPDNFKADLKKHDVKLPNFEEEYESWYSEAHAVVKQLIPDRLDDFVKQYKHEKRKEVDFVTYGISDYLLGLRTTRGGGTIVVADQSAAIPKMQNQRSILSSAEKRFESALFDIQEVLQADIYDSELDAARDLAKKGFCRGGGAIAGVVLEKHLGHVCDVHGLKTRKKHPTLADFIKCSKMPALSTRRSGVLSNISETCVTCVTTAKTATQRRKMFWSWWRELRRLLRQCSE